MLNWTKMHHRLTAGLMIVTVWMDEKTFLIPLHYLMLCLRNVLLPYTIWLMLGFRHKRTLMPLTIVTLSINCVFNISGTGATETDTDCLALSNWIRYSMLVVMKKGVIENGMPLTAMAHGCSWKWKHNGSLSLSDAAVRPIAPLGNTYSKCCLSFSAQWTRLIHTSPTARHCPKYQSSEEYFTGSVRAEQSTYCISQLDESEQCSVSAENLVSDGHCACFHFSVSLACLCSNVH